MVLKQNCAKLMALHHNIFLEDKKAFFANFAKTPPFLCLSYYPLGTLYLFQQNKMLFLQGIKEELISPFDIHIPCFSFLRFFSKEDPALTLHSCHTRTHSHTSSAGCLHYQNLSVFYLSSNKFLYLLKYLNILDN